MGLGGSVCLVLWEISLGQISVGKRRLTGLWLDFSHSCLPWCWAEWIPSAYAWLAEECAGHPVRAGWRQQPADRETETQGKQEQHTHHGLLCPQYWGWEAASILTRCWTSASMECVICRGFQNETPSGYGTPTGFRYSPTWAAQLYLNSQCTNCARAQCGAHCIPWGRFKPWKPCKSSLPHWDLRQLYDWHKSGWTWTSRPAKSEG